MKAERVRVLYLINDLRTQGGAEVALANLVTHLDQEQLDIYVGGVFRTGPLAERLGLPASRIINFGFKHRFYFDLPSLGKLVFFLRNQRIQVIHTHLFAANTVGRLAAFLARVPIVVATEHNTYFNKSRLSAKIDWALAQVTSQMTAVSEGVRSFAAKQAGLPVERFVLIPNGIPLEKIPRLSANGKREKFAQLGINDERPIVISVGRLTEQKGFPVLIRAARHVIQKFPAVLFLIAGSGPLQDELQHLIDQAGLHQTVCLLGYRSDVYELFQISTVLAMPSYWEGLPVTLIEASACRLPIIASDVGGVAEIVKDKRSGLLVKPGDDDLLGAAIMRLLNQPELREEMGEYGLRWVKMQFSADKVARKTAELYYQLWTTQRIRRRRFFRS